MDGYLLDSERIGNFEWWYFDCRDSSKKCTLKIVVHLGSDPLRKRFFPTLAISIKTPELSEAIEHSYDLKDFNGDRNSCDVRIGKDAHIYAEADNPGTGNYHIEIDLPEFQSSLTFKQIIPPWQPPANLTKLIRGRRNSEFFWNVPQPGARVDGRFTFKNSSYTLENAIGYHDHNYWQLNSKPGLFMDEVFRKWVWGKCLAGPYTVIFAEILMKGKKAHSIMVAEHHKIVYSTNKNLTLTIDKEMFHAALKSTYPSQITIDTKNESFPLSLVLNFEELVDSKNLLKGVNPLMGWLIKNLVARPAYYGINSSARLEIANQTLEGFGNYELMLFRNR